MEQAKVVGGALRVYLSPTTAGTVMGCLAEGSIVDVVSKRDDVWWMISRRGTMGYAMRAQLVPYSPKHGKDQPSEDLITISIPRAAAKELCSGLIHALDNKKG